MKKKLLALILTGTMLLSFGACTNEASTAEQTETNAESTSKEIPAENSDEAKAADTSSEQKESEESLIRSTAYGDVKGINNENCLVWYGIPYAKAPVGELRWKEPADPDPWDSVMNCENPSEGFIQSATDYSTGENVISGTEDSLNLDIYTTQGADKLPVLVYLHGGNNQTGTSLEIPGTEIAANESCVYVSVNYRLGLLGFNCLPALQTEEGSTGNYSLQDIAKSLDWVKQNISNFGGDPDNITVSGFSAGGRDVMAMLISPLFEGKFQKAIAFSGGMTTADEETSKEQIAAAIAPLAVEDGKAENEEAAIKWLLTDALEVSDYLYGIDSERICTLMANAGIRMSVFPHLYTDGVAIPKEGFATAKYNSVPLLMLTGTTEFSLFSAFDGYFFSDSITALAEEEQQAAKDFAIIYGSDMYRIFNAQCSAQTMYENYDSDMYLCQVEYGSKDSLTQIPTMGSFHGVFVPMLTSEHGYASFGDFSTEGYKDMAQQFNKYLKNFLSTGNPNGEALTEWSVWTPENTKSLVLDADASKAVVEMKDVSTTYEDIISQMDAEQTVAPEIKEGIIKNVLNGRWFSEALDKHYGNVK